MTLYQHYIISLYLTAITVFCLAVFVSAQKLKPNIKIPYVLYSLCISIWGSGQAWALQETSRAISLFAVRNYCHSGVIFIPIFFIHFVLALLDKDKEKKNFIVFCYLIGTILLILDNTTALLVRGVETYSPVFNLVYLPGYLHPVMIAFFVSLVVYGNFLLFKGYRKAGGVRYMQLKWLCWITILAYIGGAPNFLLGYRIQLKWLMPFGTYLLPIYVAGTTYAIVRHHLMDIEVIIKKTLVFAGIFAFVFGVVVAVAMLVAQLLGGANNLLTLAISALIITFTLRPIEIWLVNATDKFLFQKKYEYKQILRAFIDEVITVLNLDEVVNSTLKLLDQTLHPYTSAVFILNKVEDKYQIYNSQGLEDKNIIFSSDSKLVTFLKTAKNPAVIKHMDGITGVGQEIASEMTSIKAMVVLPLMLHNDLLGFISLGKKKSDEDYTKDDLDVLLDLARTETVAVGNAQLLTEAAQNERRAAIGTMAAGIHHEIGNPLNIINMKIQVSQSWIKKGLYKDKTIEQIIADYQDMLDCTIAQTNRISGITKRLSNFAKPSKEFKPQLLNISEEIDDTLAVIGHDLGLERIKIDKRISTDLFNILADKQEMQQIFFNLIRNAAQAIEEAGTISITAVNTTDNKIHIEIRDTGKGIPEDKMHRIFDPFFTTKGPNKGTGLGLSIVRELVWKNKGKISFTSQAGLGTTFILGFPRG